GEPRSCLRAPATRWQHDSRPSSPNYGLSICQKEPDLNNADLCYLSIADASALFEAGKLSPVELTQALFDRIDATDGAVHSYVRLMRRTALEEAAASEARIKAGQRRGPLDGIPIAGKDLFDTAGTVTTAGLGIYRERVPSADSFCV